MIDPTSARDDHDGFVIDDREVIHESLEGEAVLVHLGTGRYHSLRGTASEIWELVVAGHSGGAIVEAMTARFDGDANTIASETRRLLREVVEQGLASPAPARANTAPEEPTSRRPFTTPQLESFEDMQDLLLLDPIHETGEEGWPKRA